MPFPLDPNAPGNASPRVDPAAPVAPTTDMAAFEADAKLTIRERIALMPHLTNRDPRAALADLAPELSPAMISLVDDAAIERLTTLALQGLMSR